MKLTFYRLQGSLEEHVVNKVRLIGGETIDTGRTVHFGPTGVSDTLEAEFDYSSYFPGITADVLVSSAPHRWRCEIVMEFSRAPTLTKTQHIEPTPRSTARLRVSSHGSLLV